MKEIWRKVVGFPVYSVSNHGRVKRTVVGSRDGRCGILKPWIGTHGYETVCLSINGVYFRRLVHRLVCEAFHGKAPSKSHEVAHNDGTRTNHRADNLRWATRSENITDSIVHGTWKTGNRHFTATNPEKIARGERHGHAVLTDRKVRAIRAARVFIGSGRALAKKYGVSPGIICMIRKRKIWRHI